MENVQRLHRLISRHGAVDNSARDPPHLAGIERLRLAADGEGELSFQEHSHLFMRMAVGLHDRAGLKLDEREHHLFTGHREDVDAGEDGVAGAVLAGDVVGRHRRRI